MARQDENKGSGNDGSWFLEAVGAAPPPPTPSETVAALEFDNTLPDLEPVEPLDAHVVTFESFDGSTGTSTSTYEHPKMPQTLPPDDTGEMEALAQPQQSLMHEDTELSPVLESRRSFRWPAVAFMGFLLAVGALAALWLPAALRQEAIGVKQSYADASLSLRQELPLGQSALDTITDPASTSDELSASVPVVSQLDSAAHQLALVAAEPLPLQIPFLPVEEITSLEPLQDTALINAARGSDIARNLGHAYVYRTTVPQLLDTGDLPATADVQTINALSVSLASSLVEDSSAINDLPVTETTTALHESARSAVERYASWQDEYLTSLSEGNETDAAALIAELDDLKTTLADELETTMSTARVEIDQQIVELASDLETYLEELTQ